MAWRLNFAVLRFKTCLTSLNLLCCLSCQVGAVWTYKPDKKLLEAEQWPQKLSGWVSPGRVPQTVLIPRSPSPPFGFRNWSVGQRMYMCRRADSQFQAQASRRVTCSSVKTLDSQTEKQKNQIIYVGGKCIIPILWESNWVHSVIIVSWYDTVCYHKKTWWGIKSFCYLLSSPPLGWLYFGIFFVSTEVLLPN